MDIFAKEYFPVLKRLISQIEEHTNQISFILSSENKLLQNDMEDEEETALKTTEVLSHAKQSKLQPSEMDRDHTPDQSTKYLKVPQKMFHIRNTRSWKIGLKIMNN